MKNPKPAPPLKLDDFHYFEVMDRIGVICDNWDRHVMDHPVILANRRRFAACRRVEVALNAVSSMVAKLNFDRDDTNTHAALIATAVAGLPLPKGVLAGFMKRLKQPKKKS